LKNTVAPRAGAGVERLLVVIGGTPATATNAFRYTFGFLCATKCTTIRSMKKHFNTLKLSACYFDRAARAKTTLLR
jgi:hypothetical protein